MVFALFMLLFSAQIHAGEVIPKINLRYMERPPFIMEEGSLIYGSTATPAVEAFAQANIPIQLMGTPPSRQLMVISSSQGYDCAVGWFKNSEREKYALFTEPIYQDGSWVLIANKKTVSVQEKDLKNLFLKKNLKLITRQNYSYGSYLDRMIATEKPSQIVAEGTPAQMLQIIHSGRVDYMFLAEEEYQYQLKKNSWQPDDFLVLHFREIPSGEKRHIMCSKKVPSFVIKRLNQAIKKKTHISAYHPGN